MNYHSFTPVTKLRKFINLPRFSRLPVKKGSVLLLHKDLLAWKLWAKEKWEIFVLLFGRKKIFVEIMTSYIITRRFISS